MKLSENYIRKIKSIAGLISENKNIQTEFGDAVVNESPITVTGLKTPYVYSKTYDRLFKPAGEINLNNEAGNDGQPTLLVDENGGLYDFVSLKAENCFNVSVPENFNYEFYSKNQK